VEGYFNQAHRVVRRLSREEEREIFGKWKATGKKKYADRLVYSVLPLVTLIASRYVGTSARLDDLIQEGNVGAMVALHKFDPDKGAAFGTHAAWWISGTIRNTFAKERPALAGDSSLESDGVTCEDQYSTAEFTTKALNILDDVAARYGNRGRMIVQGRYHAADPMSFTEIGKVLQLTRQRVNKIHEDIVKRAAPRIRRMCA